MDENAMKLLPPEYAQAAGVLQKMFGARPLSVDAKGTQQLLADAQVSISKGFSVQNWKPDASEDELCINVKHSSFVSSGMADAFGKMAFSALNEIEAVRAEVVSASPKDYLAQGKERTAELIRAAKEANIPGSEVDYSKAGIFNPNLSRNQMQKYAAQIVDGPDVTSVRINIPTNPDNRDAAAALAKRVMEDLTRRLPEIKTEMIARIKKKNYIPNLTPAIEQQLQSHQLEVTTQQQGNWTSVFLNIRSPEQVLARQNPGKTPDPEALKKTNMLMQVTDEKSRFKLAARSIIFEGKELNKPASFFMEVAGTEDIKNGLGKMLHYLTLAKPEYGEKAKALMAENFLKSPEQWNLPPEQKEQYKSTISANIHPDYPDTLKIRMHLPKGKALEIVQKIAGMTQAQTTSQTAATDASLEPIANAIINAGQSLEGWADMLAKQKAAKTAAPVNGAGISAA